MYIEVTESLFVFGNRHCFTDTVLIEETDLKFFYLHTILIFVNKIIK